MTAFAVDAQPDMVAWTSREVPAVEVRIGVLPQLPFEDNEFDAVVGNFVPGGQLVLPHRALLAGADV